MPRAEATATLAAPPLTSAKSLIITACIGGSACSAYRRRLQHVPLPHHHGRGTTRGDTTALPFPAALHVAASSQRPISWIDCRADNVVQRLARSLDGLRQGSLDDTVPVLQSGHCLIATVLDCDATDFARGLPKKTDRPPFDAHVSDDARIVGTASATTVCARKPIVIHCVAVFEGVAAEPVIRSASDKHRGMIHRRHSLCNRGAIVRIAAVTECRLTLFVKNAITEFEIRACPGK